MHHNSTKKEKKSMVAEMVRWRGRRGTREKKNILDSLTSYASASVVLMNVFMFLCTRVYLMCMCYIHIVCVHMYVCHVYVCMYVKLHVCTHTV